MAQDADIERTTDLERWRQIDLIFQLTVERPQEGRGAFLDAACGDDADLRRRVESLLRLDAAEVPLLDRPPGLGEWPSLAIGVGETVGSYRINRLLGEGGTSVIYEADRVDGRLERRVAVKVLKVALFSPEALRRFLNEGHILARLEHPFIAQVYDAGTTERGFPFLVMEHVEGRRIDEFCREEDLPLGDRLELFRQVCGAVSYAHRNLVVHRDIKPSNILVTDRGVPKLLDFGIAKMLAPGADGERPLTLTAFQPMTPQYASPEQLAGATVTTSSDVYSLGMLLYELLTGHLPYRLEGGESVKSFLAQRLEIAPPSIRARQEQGGGRTASRNGSRDLDRIVMMALERDVGSRYSSVDELSDDLLRCLQGYPVRAREPSLGYRSSRFLKRHRAAVGLGAAVLVTLLAFLALLLTTTRQLAKQRDRSRIEAAQSEEVMGFLVDLFELVEPEARPGGPLTAEDLLEMGEAQLRSAQSQRPERQAAMMTALGRAYLKLSQSARARPLLESALEIRRRALGVEDPAIPDSLDLLADLEFTESNFDRAAELAGEAVTWRIRAGDRADRVAESQVQLAAALMQKGERLEAQAILEQALELAGGAQPTPLVGRILRNLGVVTSQLGRHGEAEDLLRRAITIEEGFLGPDHPNVLAGKKALLVVIGMNPRRQSEAVEGLRSVLEDERRVYGEHHHEVAQTLTNLGNMLTDMGRFEEAVAAFRQALEIHRARLGDDHLMVGVTLLGLGMNLESLGDFEAAESHLRRADAIFRQRVDATAVELAHSQRLLASVVRKRERPVEAEALAREAIAILTRELPQDRWFISWTKMTLGECLADQGRFTEAEPWIMDAHEALRAVAGEARSGRPRVAAFYRGWGRPEEAARYEAGGSRP